MTFEIRFFSGSCSSVVIPFVLGAPLGHNFNSVDCCADKTVETASKLIMNSRFIVFKFFIFVSFEGN